VSCVKSKLTDSLECDDDNRRTSATAASRGSELHQMSAAAAADDNAQQCTLTVHDTVCSFNRYVYVCQLGLISNAVNWH